MRLARGLFVIVWGVSAAVAAAAPESTHDHAGKSSAAESPNLLTLATEELLVPPGESVQCSYLEVTDRELRVYSAVSHQGPSGHHMALFYLDRPRPPGHEPCPMEKMIPGLQLVTASVGHETMHLPAGMAQRIPPGKQLVLQSHHLNHSGQTLRVTDTFDLHLLRPEDVRISVGVMTMSDQTFTIPPHARYTRTTTCDLPVDLRVVQLSGHMHELGTRYMLEVVNRRTGQMQGTLDDEAWSPSYTYSAPYRRFSEAEAIHLPAGTRLKQTCVWDNTTDAPIRFPQEMCVATLQYFPASDFRICRVANGRGRITEALPPADR